MNNPLQKPKIVVIGAGIAGLTTAYRLRQQCLNVHVYEARERVGGRILTVWTSHHLAEMGGYNIIDGGEAAHMLQLINECNLELLHHKIPLDQYYFTGKEMISINDLLKEKRIEIKTLKQRLDKAVLNSKNLQDILKTVVKEDDLLYKVLATKLSAYEGGTIERLSPIYVQTLYYMLLGGLSIVHPCEEENSVNFSSIKGGNALLPEKMAMSLSERVHLKKQLKKISKKLDRTFSLVFQDGEAVDADIVVMAIPCTVYNDIVFENGVLPKEKLDAIRNVEYGANAKIVVPFDKAPKNNKTFVNDHLGSFFDHGQKTLVLYYMGRSGKFDKHTISEAYNLARPSMEMIFQDSCPPPQLPHLVSDKSFCHYEGPIAYSWASDPYAKGSYSYIASGQETALISTENVQEETVKTLFAPIENKLYFAGEHTTILVDVPGTMEGACESGERAARMIIGSLRLPIKNKKPLL